jgi:superfamily II DNA/RNA helicase
MESILSSTTSISTFADLGVPTDIARALAAAGMHEPFPIQAASLPHALAGRDLCGRAPTGSGKTLAFALPLAVRVGRAQPGHPTGLVLTPTRELAAQVKATLEPLAQVRGQRLATIYGGTNINTDIRRLRRGVDIVVATPGRLADLVRRREIHLDAVDVVVLDEADRMADMGFLPEVTRLLDLTPSRRQTLLFSATLDGDVDVLVRRYQRTPARIEVEGSEEELGDVRHLFWATERTERRAVTARIARGAGPTIVFTRTKRGADRLAKQLTTDGIRAAAIHGDRSQRQRERALADFQDGRSTTLVATDVAARGIHVDDVAVVVHYDPPATDKDYVHRSGRTGRAGATGVVVSLVTSDDHATVDAFQRALELPRGLHPLDYGQITAAEVPDPVAPARGDRGRGGRPDGAAARGGRQAPKQGSGGGNGRARHARGGAPRGKGGSRQRRRSR